MDNNEKAKASVPTATNVGCRIGRKADGPEHGRLGLDRFEIKRAPGTRMSKHIAAKTAPKKQVTGTKPKRAVTKKAPIEAPGRTAFRLEWSACGGAGACLGMPATIFGAWARA
jgi:hypothetical protein